MELPLWVEFFDELQNVRGRSRNTVMAYRRDLEFYLKYRESHQSISGFYDYMNQHQLSSRSQARVISSLRTYYKYCESNGIKAPELRELRCPKVEVGLPRVLTSLEFEKLFNACEVEDLGKTKRNQITLLFLYGLGCRVSELIGLNLTDFSASERWVKVLGKGRKERLIPLSERLASELKFYLEEVRPLFVKENSHSILLNDRGHRPSRVDIWRWIAAWSAKAGFESPINPHRFRHGFATALLENGADLRSIQMLLGHSSIQTTQIYTSVTTGSLAQAVEEHHPFSKLDENL